MSTARILLICALARFGVFALAKGIHDSPYYPALESQARQTITFFTGASN